jgi:hypothetical protein
MRLCQIYNRRRACARSPIALSLFRLSEADWLGVPIWRGLSLGCRGDNLGHDDFHDAWWANRRTDASPVLHQMRLDYPARKGRNRSNDDHGRHAGRQVDVQARGQSVLRAGAGMGRDAGGHRKATARLSLADIGRGWANAPVVTCDNCPAPMLSSMLWWRLVDNVRPRQLARLQAAKNPGKKRTA